jgi:galactokinase/mevalonate kinase-like predicted kinase
MARQSGALGGKITGVGGGSFYLLMASRTARQKYGALTAAGAREMAFTIDVSGGRILDNDPFTDNDESVGSRRTLVCTAAHR